MIGDKLVITDYHRSAAAKIFDRLSALINADQEIIAATIAGESGCGKSETAAVLASLCKADGFKTIVLQQDDYFKLPPKKNHQKRLADISWVGPGEVQLCLLEANINAIKSRLASKLTKPLVNYELNLITEEILDLVNLKVIIVEGTYTTMLKNVDFKAFINRTFYQTKKARLKRSRDPASNFLEKVLLIEHEIIAAHKYFADIIIPPPNEEIELSIMDDQDYK